MNITTKEADWNAIEREYRAGALSVREIARRFSVPESTLRNRAKKNEWQQDLKGEVQRRTCAKLLRSGFTRESAQDLQGSPPAGNAEQQPAGNAEQQPAAEEIIEAAASRNVEVIQLHRADAQKQKKLLTLLMRAVTPHLVDEKGNQKILDLNEASTVSKILDKAARTLSSLVGIERKAYSLDDQSGDDGSPDAIQISYYREKAA